MYNMISEYNVESEVICLELPGKYFDNYSIAQVEAALTTNPDNEELLKLKADLEEVITLTKDLIKAQIIEEKGGGEQKPPVNL